MKTQALSMDKDGETLRTKTRLVLQLAAGWSIIEDATGMGIFLRMPQGEPAAYVEQALGTLDGMNRFISLTRFSPFWTKPAVGRCEADLRPETLWMLAESERGKYTLIVPLVDGPSRFSLRGGNHGLVVAAETGDPAILFPGGVAVFVAAGDDPYQLVAEGARAVQRQIGIGRLRADKPLPDTIDLFGWCTWDAFYKEVSADKVIAGLEAFEGAGVMPRLLILDDGWQNWEKGPGGEDRLISLAANDRFGGDLRALVQTAKSRFGIQRFLVWHALLGYWGGLDESAFSEYSVRTVARSFGPGLLEQEPRWNLRPWGGQVGVPASDKFAQFYDCWHAELARQGVDGVKVDAQAILESVSAGQGGRVALARESRKALEVSVTKHFGGRLINCMSCTAECAYLSESSALMRSSDDFFPHRPESHGLHLHVNAVAGMWFGEFMQPDWDMFQSSHQRAGFHAAARAISGGPVYVSDKIDAIDATLLQKLVLSDGTVLRADFPGRPTPDTLFADPTRDAVLLKIFNFNRDCGVVGLFNARHGSEQPINGTVGTKDVPGLDPARAYVAWSHRANHLWLCNDEPVAVTLTDGEWELVSFAPLERDFAAMGLADKFNSAGAIVSRTWQGNSCCLDLRDGGSFLAWSKLPPRAVYCDGDAALFVHNLATGRLQVEVPHGGSRSLVIQLG